MITATLQQPLGESASKQSVIDVFESRVRAAPNRTATVHEASEMTYGELHDYAARIATQLKTLQLQSEQTVGLCLDRSHHAIAAMLGSWLADGAFVPLDPDYPDERLRYMVDDAQVQVIVSSAQYAPLFADSGTELLLLDGSSPQSLPAADLNLLHVPAASQLAYIMYTSGSTGMPKGVPIEHGALLNYCHADAEVYQLTDTDRTLQFSTINFDIAIEEIFPPLITGGAVVIRPLERIEAQIELSALVEQYDITAIHLATGYWHEWVDLMMAAKVQAPASIRLMVVTGEKVSAAHYHRWREIEAQPALWANAYGPTETTVTATVFVPLSGWDDENLPIGKAIRGYTAYILNEKNQPVADGETGELYIGGDSLARGYLNRPDLTEKAFVEVDAGSGTAERLYRTGDLARWLPSGDIAYAGRIDHQLKIGSYRVEPGEIEAALNQYDSILESLVVADQSGNQKMLLAYLACDAENFDLPEAYGWLQQKLPPHMVPLKYILLNNFPKTINGKIDRKALPDGTAAITATQTQFSAPQTDTERQLAQVWAAQLSLTKVGRDDNFFGLGGDSLLAARTLGAIQTEMGISVSARDLFGNPQLRQLATCIDSGASQHSLLQLDHLAPPLSETPLAASQLRLWLQYEATPRNLSMFHVHEAVHIRGALHVERLSESLRQVVARHSSLQMHVSVRDGSPFMCWNEQFNLPINLDPMPSGACPASFVEDCVNNERFHLSSGPLVRCHIAKLSNDEHLLILVAHHLSADGWSMSVLLREIAAHFAGETLPAQPWQFIEFAKADNAARSTGAYEGQLDYWTSQLAELEPAEFSQDLKVPATRQFSADQISFELSKQVSQHLEATAKRLNSSAHALLMACYFSLLYRHTRSDDFAIATAVHGRNDSQLENIVGTFIGTLPIRAQANAQMSFRELVQQLRDTTRDAISNSDAHFDEIVRKINPQRVNNQLPFSPFMFLLQNIPDSELALQGLDCEQITSPIKASEYDLLLEVSVDKHNGENTYRARLAYSDELYQRSSIERFSQQFQRLLEQALSFPETAVSQLEILSESDKNSLIQDLNPSATPYEQSQNFVDLIWQQAETQPEKIAVRDDSGSTLSYADLCERAQQLALHLQHLGAGPGVLVALSMHRSVSMVVALLGILRSGGAYLPMDPSYPAERVRYILEDAQAPVLITEQALRDTLPASEAEVLCLDTDWESIAASAKGKTLEHNEHDGRMHDLAYVIYTSGSTGNPKGVQLSHRNVLNFLLSMRAEPGISSDDKLLAVTTLSFDISVLELYLPLISGAELLVASRELAIDGRRLADFIEAQSVSLLQATPATWRLLLEANWQGNGRIKGLIGGEALPADLLPRLLPMLSSLWNMYGPTETTVWSTCQQITDAHASVSIGKPIANTQIYILDEQQQLCPMGTPGELCIAGDGVSSGYSNRADLNASQFLNNPFSDQAAAKLYRTGDLARWSDTGSLSYIGRLDNLVKLNGYRIELGEIEAVLASQESIKQTAVIIREDIPGAKRLVAYWVADTVDAAISESNFQELLAKRLPSYMIPLRYIQLDAMPQTPNGKLDRKALPAPPKRIVSADVATLKTPMQQEVALQWQTLLGVESVSATDSFFALGGHSLSAVKFINWVDSTYGINLSMRRLIMGSLAQIATHIAPDTANVVDMSQQSSEGLADIAIEYIDNNGVQLFCTHITNQKPATQAILMVSSHGYEQSRMDRSYRSLATELAKHNVHSMRVDLSGTGNSSLDSSDIDTLEQWQSDIQQAAIALSQRSGCKAISVLAGRLSASLLNAKLFAEIPLDHAFLWDPVSDGAQWWKTRLDLQKSVTASGYYFLRPRRIQDPLGLQSPGLNINSKLRAEIDAFQIDVDQLDARFHVVLDATDNASDYSPAQTMRTTDQLNWSNTLASTSTDIDSFGMSQYVLSTLMAKEQ